MLLGKVVGTVVSSQKAESLNALRFMIVKAMDERGQLTGGTVVAIDAVGSGVGEVVLYASGSSARQTETTRDRPVDATIMAIVDEVSVGETTTYRK